MDIQKVPPFPSRALVLASANMLKALGHSGFDELRLEWSLEDTDAGTGGGLAARATSLASFALKNPELHTPEGLYLQSAIVVKAGEIYRQRYTPNIGEKERSAFQRASAQAGSMNNVLDDGEILAPFEHVSKETPTEAIPFIARPKPLPMLLNRKVFVVHGHDEGAREMVARYLEKIDFEAVILHEQANRGRTVMEKVEAHGDVGFAVVLLTPDDEGRKLHGNLEPRARQNVILELGYFIGRLGRAHVCALTRGDIELPSDFAGVVYEPLDGNWRSALARELEDAGFDIDWKKVSRP